MWIACDEETDLFIEPLNLSEWVSGFRFQVSRGIRS
jgi:hypothetical protein